MAPSMSKPMASVNPCPNPHIPPIRFEFNDILAASLVQDFQEHRIQSERALRAYWAQAANMTKADQKTYIRLLKNGSFVVPKRAIVDPSNHPLYEELATEPSWPKYVMLKAIYGPEICDSKILSQKAMVKLEIELESVFGSLDIKDLTSIYRQAHLVKRKREQDSESDDDEDIPCRIVKKQSPECPPTEKTTVTTTRAQRSQYGAQRAVALKSTTSPLTTRVGINMEEALEDQNALLKKRCDALESSVADLQRKIDSSHFNLVVLLTTILEKVGHSAEGIDAMRREFEC
ncbi:hypothetical protein ACHAO4_010251 [Trichoderma viride]